MQRKLICSISRQSEFVKISSLFFQHRDNHASYFDRTDVEVMVNQIIFEEPLVSKHRKPQLRRLIYSTYLFAFVFTVLKILLLSKFAEARFLDQLLWYGQPNHGHYVLARFLSWPQFSCPHFLLELIEKQEANDKEDFYLYKILRAHILPLTNCAFNKSGDKCVLIKTTTTKTPSRNI